MARIVNKPADVVTGPGGRYRVREVLDYWLVAGRWWEQESEKATWRVATVEGGVFELEQDLSTRTWLLYKSYD